MHIYRCGLVTIGSHFKDIHNNGKQLAFENMRGLGNEAT